MAILNEQLLLDMHAEVSSCINLTYCLQEVEGVEIIFVSSDRSPADMEAYMKESHGDWWGVEHGSSAVEALKSHFGIRGIPALIVVDKNGDVITKDGRADVQSKGPGVVAQWKKGKV